MTALPAHNIHYIHEQPAEYTTKPNGHFTSVDDNVVDSILDTLTPEILGVYMYLERRVNASGSWAGSYSRMLDDLKLRKATLISHLRALADHGFITIHTDDNPCKSHIPNTYRLPHHRRSDTQKAGTEAGTEAGTGTGTELVRKLVGTGPTLVDQVDTSISLEDTRKDRLRKSFARFRSAYPKPMDDDAKDAWADIDPDEATVTAMLDAIPEWMKSEDWTKDGGKWIHRPSGWLRGRKWLLTPEPVKASGPPGVTLLPGEVATEVSPGSWEMVDTGGRKRNIQPNYYGVVWDERIHRYEDGRKRFLVELTAAKKAQGITT